MELKKYKISALIGIIIMGLGSFMACLSGVSEIIILGDVLLILSLLIMGYGFSQWQP